jgi:hypothetical protein
VRALVRVLAGRCACTCVRARVCVRCVFGERGVRVVRAASQLAKLEVKLMTRQADESEEVARIREVLSAQSEQIVSLVAEKEVRCGRSERAPCGGVRPCAARLRCLAARLRC